MMAFTKIIISNINVIISDGNKLDNKISSADIIKVPINDKLRYLL